MSTSRAPRASVVGAGLIGGSVGMALRAQGWHVTGCDLEPSRAARGVELGAFDATAASPLPGTEITFVCTPVLSIAELAKAALAEGSLVTDVGSVKAAVVEAIDHPLFVGGHPMAGSEQEGIDGSTAEMFNGRAWVLTPNDRTDPQAYARVHTVVSSLGAYVITTKPARHDELVALVSHVPHLTAATLMTLAADTSDEDATLLRLAAGGFRDMTRIASGHHAIWLDICTQNRTAIRGVLDRLIESLSRMRQIVDESDRASLAAVLQRARAARVSLPTGAPPPEELKEVRVLIPDRPGFIAEITTLASELGVNIFDIEIAHSAEGDRGVLLLVVAASSTDLLRGGLMARGFRPTVTPLTTG